MYLDSKLTKNDRENSLRLDIHTRWMQRKDFLLKNLNPRKLLFSWPKSYLLYKGKSGNQEVSGCDIWVEKIRLLPLRYWFFALMASQGQFLTKMKEKKIHYFLKSKGIFPHLIKLLNDFCSYFFLATVCTFPNIIVFKNVLPFLDSASCCKTIVTAGKARQQCTSIFDHTFFFKTWFGRCTRQVLRPKAPL